MKEKSEVARYGALWPLDIYMIRICQTSDVSKSGHANRLSEPLLRGNGGFVTNSQIIFRVQPVTSPPSLESECSYVSKAATF